MKLPIGLCAIPGDVLLMELLFMNIVGKAIHRVPRNGRISISLTETKNDFCLEVVDNGYTDTSSAEKLIKKSFDLFLSDGNFLHICQENGLNYKHKKETNGLNASCLILPFKEEEVPKNNVVKLFKT
jgi:K+-sensing histidine kinase KdpD